MVFSSVARTLQHLLDTGEGDSTVEAEQVGGPEVHHQHPQLLPRTEHVLLLIITLLFLLIIFSSLLHGVFQPLGLIHLLVFFIFLLLGEFWPEPFLRRTEEAFGLLALQGRRFGLVQVPARLLGLKRNKSINY